MKTAKSNDWKTEPMPLRHTVIGLNRDFSDREMSAIQLGVIPEQMEDRWFVFFENDSLHFHRSWTGYCIYQLHFLKTENGWRAMDFVANRDKDQYGATDDDSDLKLLSSLIDQILLRRPTTYPIECASKVKEEKMASQMAVYRAELVRRYWEYQKSRFPEWRNFFDRPYAQDIRPPVFCVNEAWRNIIVKSDASQPEIDGLRDLLPKSARHKWFRSMNSSQALAQSVLGNLTIYDYLSSLTELHDDDGNALLGKAQALSANFAMEFKINYLGEPRPTSLDGYFGGDYRVAIECKFTESEVGTCSRPRLTRANSNYESEYCNGIYTKQKARQGRCSLTEIGVLYWRYIPQLFRWNSEQNLVPCPLKAKYQLIRNILAIGVKPDGQVSSANGHVLLIYDERNPAFQKDGKGFIAFTEAQQALQEPTMLRKCSWQRIIHHMRNKGILLWLTDQLALKYGL
jgi:hypothetical protein